MWTPDPVFRHQESTEEVESIIKKESDASFNLEKVCDATSTTNKLTYKQTMTIAIDCTMEFSNFPFDTQNCGFYLTDMAQNDQLTWLEPQITSEKLTNSDYDVQIENTKSPIGFNLELKRKPTVYLYTHFLPCALMVVVSWVSFSVKVDAIPGRLGLLITLLLMMINLTSSTARTIPRSDEVCPLIAWIILSAIFVVIALAEYFIILVAFRFSCVGKVRQNLIFNSYSYHIYL